MKKYVIAGLFTVLALLILLPFGYSFIIDYDYFKMARTGLELVTQGSYTFHGHLASWFPPFTPLLLGLIYKLGLSPLWSILSFNALCLGLTTYFFFILLRNIGISFWWGLIFSLLIPLNSYLIMVLTLINSDALFYAGLSLFNYCLYNYLSDKRRYWLWWMGALISVIALQKTSVLSLSLIPLVTIFWESSFHRSSRKRDILKKKLEDALIFVNIAFFTQIIWITRNLSLGLPPMGRAELVSPPIQFNWKKLLSSLEHLILHSRAEQNAWIIGCAVLILIALSTVIFLVCSKAKKQIKGFILLLLGECFLLISVTIYAYFHYDLNICFDERLSFPLALNLLTICAVISGHWAQKRKVTALVILISFFAIRFFTFSQGMEKHYRERIQGKLAQLKQSPILHELAAWAEENPHLLIFSNRPHFLYGQLTPKAKVYKLREFDSSVLRAEDNLKLFPTLYETYLWEETKFYPYWIQDEVISRERITKLVDLEEVGRDEFSVLYRVTPKKIVDDHSNHQTQKEDSI